MHGTWYLSVNGMADQALPECYPVIFYYCGCTGIVPLSLTAGGRTLKHPEFSNVPHLNECSRPRWLCGPPVLVCASVIIVPTRCISPPFTTSPLRLIYTN